MTTYKSDFLTIMQERGFIHQGSDLAGLDAKLCSGVQSAYIGFDATAKSYHVGNLVQITFLYWFQQCGHKPITLMGGGTTKVGDPSGKDEMRKMLTDADIDNNIQSLQKIFAKFLKYGDGPTDARMVNNDEWLADIKYIPFLRDYGRHFSVNRMLTMDSVKLRLDRDQPLSFLEFNYMILQGYDFLELHRRYGTILQMGGADQWGNILMGVDLGRRAAQAELFALTTPLITTSDGKKMGKTAAGAVWLNADMLAPYDYYQFWRNTTDADVGRMLSVFTTLPMSEVRRLEKLQGQEINEAKKILSYEATKLCHGEAAAADAAATAQKVFEEGGAGGDLPVIEIVAGAALLDVLVQAKLAPSKGEARRLVQSGGIRCNDEPITDPAATLTAGETKLSAGKKRHVIVRAA